MFRRRWFNLAVLVFQTFWLNVVIPGHQRGVVQLPGSRAVVSCCCCCCEKQPASPADSKSKTPAAPTGTCAICFFAAHLTIPPVVDFTPPPLKLLGPLADEIPHPPIAKNIRIPFDGRGPPAIA